VKSAFSFVARNRKVFDRMVLKQRVRIGVAIGVALTLGIAVAADDDMVKPLRNIAGGSANGLTTQALSSGVKSCAGRIDQVANFLTKSTQSSALMFLPERDFDNSMVSVSAEVDAQGVPRAYASATFSPNTAMGCAGMYETVQYWGESCNSVAARIFKGATPSGPLGSEIAVLSIGPSARVFMIRATTQSCVTIKKEVLR
jgi:hypothetical protein